MGSSVSSSDAPWTIGRLLQWTTEHFQSRAIDEPRLCAELLLAHALGCRRIELYTRFEQVPSQNQREAFRELVRQAGRHHPIAYLVGRKEFYSLDFFVTADVLIPRPETELLVEESLAWCAAHAQDRYDVLDVGTGSGCIGVTVARLRPNAHVVATDIAEAALAVAAQNARRHEVADRMRFVRADMLDLPAEAIPAGRFDIVVSNPPYVAGDRPETLNESVRRHEPAVALFGGPDGLDAYRRLSRDLDRVLRRGGLLVVEVGCEQAETVTNLLIAAPGIQPIARRKDAHGIERALTFTLSP